MRQPFSSNPHFHLDVDMSCQVCSPISQDSPLGDNSVDGTITRPVVALSQCQRTIETFRFAGKLGAAIIAT
jgi:hypothetical protein